MKEGRDLFGAVALALYSAAVRLVTPAALLRYWWRGRAEPGYRASMSERLGRYVQGSPAGAVWLHAVSLGETRAARALVDALRQQWPGMQLVLTHGTATGREAGRALLREGDIQAWFPLDTPGATRRFVAHFRPSLGVLMETEIWPNLMRAAQQAGLPMVLANARLSEKSRRKGERFGRLLRPALRGLSLVLAQTGDDARRLTESGASPVIVTGNLKFDLTPDPQQWARGRAWREALPRKVVLAASSREGEEAPLLAAWSALALPRPLLLLVPRHPQRFDEVHQLVREHGLSVARRSTWGAEPPPPATSNDVWLGDSIGEMSTYYGAAHVALLGGSFAPLGGQNLIEAAACGCPIVMGPFTYNFADAAELALQAGAAIRVQTPVDGVNRAVNLVDSADSTAWSARASRFATEHRGAAMRMAAAIAQLPDLGLPAPAPASADDGR